MKLSEMLAQLLQRGRLTADDVEFAERREAGRLQVWRAIKRKGHAWPREDF